ncbi:MAG: hypothetical protein WC404_01050, partial [Candidatus Omnitrophota bacterium]
VSFAQGGPQESQAVSSKASASKTDQLINLREFSIPRNLGTTKEAQSFNSKEVIINIKDAHDNLSAQESIVGLLDNLVTNYDIRTIAVEGSAGYVDTSIISSFPDREIKKELSDKLMAEGLISAAEYYSIITESGVAIYGIDDKKLHSEDMDAFRTCLEKRQYNYKKARALYQCLAALEDNIYSAELRVLEANSILKNNGNVGFTNRWDNIRAIGEKNGVKPASFANINNLLQAIALEKKCDFNSTNTERQALMNELKTTIDKNKLEELILKSISFKLGKISASMYYSHLVDLARLAKIDLEKKYPNILTYVEYMTLYESVDINALKDEVIDYENRIKEKVFRNEDEKTLAGLLRKASMLQDLIEVKLTSTSLKYFDEHRKEFNQQEFTDFINRMYKKYDMKIPSDLDIEGIFEAMPAAETFYALTLKRNDAIVANTIKYMRDKGETVAALVTGGFHTDGIVELLKKDKLSYLIILPKFDKKKERPYITIITNKKSAYSDLTESGEYHIALETFFNDPTFVKEQAGTLAERLTAKFGEKRAWDTIKALRNYTDLYSKAQEAKVGSGELTAGKAKANVEMISAVLQAMENKLKEGAAAVREMSEEVAKAAAERRARAETARAAAEAERKAAAEAARMEAEKKAAEAAKIEAERKAAEEESREAGAGRRIGTYEDAGKKAEALDARQGEFLAQAETSGVTETIEGEEAIVIGSDLGDAAVAYQFTAKEGKLKGKLIIVENTNTQFISNINKALENTGFTYVDVMREMKAHEVFEARRLRQGYNRLEAHRLASIDHALKFGQKSLAGLTPYHYAELMQVETEAQLEKLLAEDRSSHQALYAQVGRDYLGLAAVYEETMKSMMRQRLAQMQTSRAEKARAEAAARQAQAPPAVEAPAATDLERAMLELRHDLKQAMARRTNRIIDEISTFKLTSIRGIFKYLWQGRKLRNELKKYMLQWASVLEQYGLAKSEADDLKADINRINLKNAAEAIYSLRESTNKLLDASELSAAENICKYVQSLLFELDDLIHPSKVSGMVNELPPSRRAAEQKALAERFKELLIMLKDEGTKAGMQGSDIDEAVKIIDAIISDIDAQKETGRDTTGSIQVKTNALVSKIRAIAYGKGLEHFTAVIERKLDGAELSDQSITRIFQEMGISDIDVQRQGVIHVFEKEAHKDKVKRLAEYIIGLTVTGAVGTQALERVFGADAELKDVLDNIKGALALAKAVQAMVRGDGKGRDSAIDCLEKKLSGNFGDAAVRRDIAACYQLATILAVGQSPFIEQVIAGIFMADSYFVDMSTGSGKTLAYPVPNILNRARGLKSIHLVTHDSFTERDFRETQFIYKLMGYKVAYMRGDMRDLRTACSILENNDVVIMSYGALSFTTLSAVQDETRPESEKWFKLLRSTRLTMDECDVAPYLADFIIAAQQSKLDVKEYVKYMIMIWTAQKLYDAEDISVIHTLLEENRVVVKQGVRNAEEQLKKLRRMMGLGEDQVKFNDDGSLQIGSSTFGREEGVRRTVNVSGSVFAVYYARKTGFEIVRTEAVGAKVKEAGSLRLDTTSETAAAGERTRQAVENTMETIVYMLSDMFPELLDKEARKKFLPTWEEFLDCAKAMYIDKMNEDYKLKYAEKRGTETIDVAILDDGSVKVARGGKDYKAPFDVIYEGGAARIIYNGETRCILDAKFFERSDQDRVIAAGMKRYMIFKGPTGGYLLREVEMEVVLLDKESGRELEGQRRDRFHTLYELKHQGRRGDRPNVRGDNQSTEYLTFTDVARFTHSYGGASGSVATVGDLMLKIFERSKGVIKITPAFSKKGPDAMPVFRASTDKVWETALERIADLYTYFPDASLIIYLDDMNQAREFEKRLSNILEGRGINKRAGGKVSVNIFADEDSRSEVEIVEKAGKARTITLTDAKLGRATNVRLAESVGFKPDNLIAALTKALQEKGVDSTGSVEKLTDLLASDKGLFYESDYAARAKLQGEIEGFLKSIGIGEDSQIWWMLRNKYFNGLYLMPLTPNRSDQGEVQMFGRAKRQGDFGRVDPFYSLEEGSKFYKMVQQLYDPRYNPSLTPKEKENGRKKFEEFLAKTARLGEIEGAVFDASGRFKGDIDSGIFDEWCSLQNYFTDLLKTVQFEAQKHRDESRIDKMKRDSKIQKILEKVRAYPVKFNNRAKKADHRFLEKYLENQLDAILDIYFDPQRVVIGEDDIGRLDLEECLGVIEQRFHIDLGAAKDRVNQLALNGTNSAEIIAARNNIRAAILSDLKKLGTVFMQPGAESTLWVGNNYYTLQLNAAGVVEIKGAGFLNADKEIEKIGVEYSRDRLSVRIGEDTYAVSYEGGGISLLQKGEVVHRLIMNEVAGGAMVEMEGAFAAAVKTIYGEGLDTLKKKIIREARERGEVVETDTSEEGLANAAIEEARKRYFDERGKHTDYASEDGQREIAKARERIEPVLNGMADALRNAEKEAEDERIKLKDEGKIKDEHIKEERSVRSVAKTAGAERSRDVEVAPVKVQEAQEVMAAAADISNQRYSTPGKFGALIEGMFFEGRSAAVSLLHERAREQAEKDRKDEKEKEDKAERDALQQNIGYGGVGGGIFIEVPETSEGGLSDEQRVIAFASCPPVPEGERPPLLVIACPAHVLRSMNDDDKKKILDDLKTRYGAAIPPGGRLLVSFDRQDIGSVTDEINGTALRGFKGVIILDEVSVQALAAERQKNNKISLSGREGDKVFTRKVGDSNFLVISADDNTTYVMGLGEKVLRQTRTHILHANALITGEDRSRDKAGLLPADYELTARGLFMRSTGACIVDFDAVITENTSGKEEVERMPLTKETGLPVRGWAGENFANKMKFLAAKIGEALTWLKWNALIGPARWLEDGKKDADFMFEMAVRKRAKAAIVFYGFADLSGKLLVGIPAYLIKDARRDFNVWGYRNKLARDRILDASRQAWSRIPWYQSVRYRLDSVKSDNKALKGLARFALGSIDFFTAGFNFRSKWASAKLAPFYFIRITGAIIAGILWKLPKKILKVFLYDSWHYPYSKIKGWLEKRREGQWVEPEKDEVLRTRLYEKVRDGSITAEEAMQAAEKIAGKTAAPEDKKQIADMLVEASLNGAQDSDAVTFIKIGQITLRLAEASLSLDSDIKKKEGRRLLLEAYNYFSVASALNPKDMAIKAYMAVILYSLGGKENAARIKAILKEVVKRADPAADPTLMARAIYGKILEEEKDYKEAAKTYEKISVSEVTVLGEKISVAAAKARCLERSKEAEKKEGPKKEGVSVRKTLTEIRAKVFNKNTAIIAFIITAAVIALAVFAPGTLLAIGAFFKAVPLIGSFLQATFVTNVIAAFKAPFDTYFILTTISGILGIANVGAFLATSILKGIKGIYNKVYGWFTDPFAIKRLTSTEIRDMKKSRYMAEPRIRLIKYYKELGKTSKKADDLSQKMIKDTIDNIIKGRIAPEEAVKFIDYLAATDAENASRLLGFVYERNKDNASVLLLRARLALMDRPIEGVRIAGGPEGFNDIAIECALKTLELDPANINAKLILLEAYKNKCEKENDKKSFGDHAALAAELDGSSDKMTEEQLKSFRAAGEAVYKEEGRAPARDDLDKAKESDGPASAPICGWAKEAPAAREPKKYSGEKAEEERLKTLEDIFKRDKKMSSGERIELASIYITRQEYAKVLKVLRGIKAGDTDAAIAARIAVECCVRIKDEVKWWKRPVFLKIWILRRAINRLKGAGGDNAAWADWVRNTVYSPNIYKAQTAFEAVAGHYVKDARTGEEKNNNFLIETGLKALGGVRNKDIRKAAALDEMLSSEQLPADRAVFKELSVSNSTQLKRAVARRSAEELKYFIRDRTSVLNAKIAEMVRIDERLKLGTDSYATDQDERNSLNARRDKLQRDILLLEDEVLGTYARLVQSEAPSAAVVNELSSLTATFIKAHMLNNTPAQFKDCLDRISAITEAGLGKAFLYTIFMGSWLQKNCRTYDREFEYKDQSDEAKNIPLVAKNKTVLLGYVKELLRVYEENDNETLRHIIRDILEKVSEYKINGEWSDTGRQTFAVMDDVITELAGVKDDGIKALEMRLRAKAFRYSLGQARTLTQQGKPAQDEFMRASLMLSGLSEYYAEGLVKKGISKEERKEYLNRLMETVSLLYGQDTANVMKMLLERIVTSDMPEEEVVSGVKRIMEDIEFAISLSQGPDTLSGKTIIKRLLMTNEISLKDRISIVNASGNLLDLDEKLNMLIGFAGQNRGNGKEYSLCLDAIEEMVKGAASEDITAGRIAMISSILSGTVSDGPETLSKMIHMIAVIMEKKKDISGPARAALNNRFEDLKKALINKLDERRIMEEGEGLRMALARVEGITADALRYESSGKFKEAEEMLNSAIDALNGLFERSIDYTRKEKPSLPINKDIRDKATEIAGRMEKVLRAQGKHYEADLMRARGYVLLAKYAIIVDNDYLAAQDHIAEARRLLERADILRPNQAILSIDMMELEVLELEIIRSRLKESAGSYDAKDKKAKDLDKQIEGLNERVKKAKEEIALDERQAEIALASAGKIAGDDGAARNDRQARLDRVRAGVSALEGERRDAEAARVKTVAGRDESGSKKAGYEQEERDVYQRQGARIKAAILKAFQAMRNADYEPSDPNVKTALTFLASLPSDFSGEVSAGIEAIILSQKFLKGASLYKRKAFAEELLLEIYFKGNKDALMGALRQIEATAGYDIVKMNISGKEFAFDSMRLLEYIIGKAKAEDNGVLAERLWSLYRSAMAAGNTPLAAAALAGLYDIIDPGSDAELVSPDNFEKDGSIKAEKRADLEFRMRKVLEARKMDALRDNAQAVKDLVSLMEAVSKSKKKWEEIKSSGRIEKIEFIIGVCDQPGKEAAVARLYKSIRDNPASAEEQRKALEWLGKGLIRDKSGDHALLRQISDELYKIDDKSALAGYFLGVSYYLMKGASTDDNERRKRYWAIQLMEDYIKSSPDDEEARVFLADIHEEQHNEIYGDNVDGRATDPAASKYFSELSNFFVQKSDQAGEKGEGLKRTELLEKALKFAGLAVNCNPRSGALALKVAQILVKLGRTEEAGRIAQGMIDIGKASREEKMFKPVVNREDEPSARLVLADIMIMTKDFTGVIKLLGRGILFIFGGRVFTVWTRWISANIVARIAFAHFNSGNMARARWYISYLLRIAEKRKDIADADILNSLADILTQSNSYADVTRALELRKMRMESPGVNKETEKKIIAGINLKLAQMDVPSRWWQGKASVEVKERARKRENIAAAREVYPEIAKEADEAALKLNNEELASLSRNQEIFWRTRDRSWIGRLIGRGFIRLADASERIVKLYAENATLFLDQADKESDAARKVESINKAEDELNKLQGSSSMYARSYPPEYNDLLARILAFKGDQAMAGRDLEAALSYYDEALTKDENNADASLGKGLILLETPGASLPLAAGYIEKAISSKPALDGADLRYSLQLIDIYKRLGQVEKVKEIEKKMEARLLRADTEKAVKGIDAIETGARSIDAIIREMAAIKSLKAGIKEGRAKLSKTLRFVPRGEKIRIYTRENLKIDEEELGRRAALIENRMNEFAGLLRRQDVFNNVIGNARGKPADEAIAYFEALVELIDKNSELKQDRDLTDEVNFALAELYYAKNNLRKAATFSNKIKLTKPPEGDADRMAIVIKRLILSAQIELAEGKSGSIGKAANRVAKAIKFSINLNNIYKDRTAAGGIFTALQNIIATLERSDIPAVEAEALRNKILAVSVRSIPLITDKTECAAMIRLALRSPSDAGSSLLTGILSDKALNDQTRSQVLEEMIGRISRDWEILADMRIGRDNAAIAWLRGLKSSIEPFMDSSQLSARARANLLLGTVETDRIKRRSYVKEALRQEEGLAKTQIISSLLANIYRQLDPRGWRLRIQTRRIASAIIDVARAASEAGKTNPDYHKAVILYERAVKNNPALKKDTEVMNALSGAYEKDAGSLWRRLRASIATEVKRRENAISWKISRLKAAINIVVDEERRAGLREKLIEEEKALGDLLIERYKNMSEARRGRAWAATSRRISAIKTELGRLSLENMKYFTDITPDKTRATEAFNMARLYFEEAVKFNENNPDAKAAVESLDREPGPQEDADSLMKEATDRISEGRLEDALAILDKALAMDKEKKTQITQEKNTIKRALAIIDSFLDYFVRENYSVRYGGFNTANDRDGRKRRQLQDDSMRSLSSSLQDINERRRVIFDEWFSRKEMGRSHQDYENEFTRLMDAILRSAGKELKDVRPEIENILFAGMLNTAEKLIDEGRYGKAELLLSFMVARDKNDERIQAARFLKAKASLLSFAAAENRTVAQIKGEADRVLANFRGRTKKEKEYKGKFALVAAVALQGRTAPSWDESRKDERKLAVDATEGYLKAAVRLDPSNSEALRNIADFYGRGEPDKLFMGENGRIISNAVQKQDDVALLSILLKAALRGTINAEKAAIANEIIYRIDAVKRDNPRDILILLKDILPVLRTMQRSSILNIDASIGRLVGQVDADPVLSLNPDTRAFLQIFLSYAYLGSGQVSKVSTILKELSPASDKEKAELLFAKLRLHLLASDIPRAEYAFRLLSAAEPSLTPEARTLIAIECKEMADNTQDMSEKKELLKKAVYYWPKFTDAHKALRSLYSSADKEYGYEEEIIKGLEGVTDTMPRPMSLNKREEVVEHILKAPILERLIYVGMPTAIVLLGGSLHLGLVGALGVIPLGSMFNVLMAAAQLPFIYHFMKKHEGERWAAWAVSAASIALPFFNMPPLYNVAIAVGIHSLVNLVIFTINTIAKEQAFNYATKGKGMANIPPGTAAMERPAEPQGKVSIGIVAAENEISALPKVAGVEYIALSRGGKDGMLELESKSPQAIARIIVDIGRITPDAVTQISKIAEKAGMQALLMSPYLAGLDENNISNLSRPQLIRIVDVINYFMPEAVSMNLEFILDENAYLNEISTSVPIKPAGYTRSGIGPSNTEQWVESFVKVLERYRSRDRSVSESAAKEMDNMRYDMLDYLRGKAPSEIKDILARHEAVAAAQFWEEKFRASGTSLMLCGSLIEEIIKRIKARNGLCVLAFD